MTITSLNNALTGLKAAQSAINTLSNNIANAATEGYTRKILPQSTLLSESGIGLGAQIGEIIRKVDTTLIRDLLTQTSATEAANVREGLLSRITGFHGSSDQEVSLASQLSKLNDSFNTLSAAADDPVVLSGTLAQAQKTAASFNDLGQLMTKLRNDAQNDLTQAVNDVNDALEKIAELNVKINAFSSAGKSIASYEDQRDMALQEVAKRIDINYYRAENNQIVVLTKQGQTLADQKANPIIFHPTPLGTSSSYGNGGAASLEIEVSPAIPPVDITRENLGGSIGALVELRDVTLVRYQAQVDELAQKTARRFADQGLALYTDADGNVPDNVAPPAPVDYTGFAATMQVNEDIVNDISLLRRGTNGETVQAGSTEIIDRVIDFAFGQYQYQQGIGTLDISAGTIFAAAGLQQESQYIATADITDFNPLTDNPDIPAGGQFQLDFGAGPFVVTVNAADTATDLVNNINAAAGGAGTARLNGLGQLVLEANADIAINDVSMGAAGMTALGLTPGVTAAENPSFTVQVGQRSPVTINIDPADTQADLLASLNAVSGLSASLGAGGELVMETIDPITGANTGALKVIDGLGSPLAAMGVTISSVAHEAFRTQNLGIDGDVETQISGVTTLEDFGRSMVSFHAEEHADAVRSSEDETVFYNTLNERNQNESGVDIDQELSELIKFQTAYTAATQMIRSADELFDDLLSAFR